MSTNPPDGWLPVNTWNTNVSQDTSVVQVGTSSVKFPSAGAAANNWLYADDNHLIPVAAGDILLFEGWTRASRRSAGDEVYNGVYWHKANGDTISVVNPFYALVNVVDTWELKSAVAVAPALACSARPLFGAANAARDAWWNSLEVRAIPASFFAILTADQSCSVNEVIVFNDVTDTSGPCFNYGDCLNTGTGLFTARKTGLHGFRAGALLEELAATKSARLTLELNGNAWIYGQSTPAPTADFYAYLSVSASPVWLNVGDTVGVSIWHDHGSDRNIVGAGGPCPTSFCGGELF